MNGNGDNYDARLGRIEGIVEALAVNQRQLLTAQVLLTEQVERTQKQAEVTQKQIEHLGVRVEQVEGQIEALVKVVDGMIRG